MVELNICRVPLPLWKTSLKRQVSHKISQGSQISQLLHGHMVQLHWFYLRWTQLRNMTICVYVRITNLLATRSVGWESQTLSETYALASLDKTKTELWPCREQEESFDKRKNEGFFFFGLFMFATFAGIPLISSGQVFNDLHLPLS